MRLKHKTIFYNSCEKPGFEKKPGFFIFMFHTSRRTILLKNIISAIPGVCFLIVPVIVCKQHFHLFEAMKNFVFASLMIIGIACLLIEWILERRINIKHSSLTLSVLIYSGYQFISCIVFPYSDWCSFFYFGCCIILFLLMSSGISVRARNRILQVLILVALLSSLYGGLQFFRLDPYNLFGDYFGSKTRLGIRIFTTFGHPNLLGGFYVFTLPVTLAFFFKTRQKKKSLQAFYYGSVTGLSFIALLMAQARGAIVAVICCLGVTLVKRFNIFFFAYRWRRQVVRIGMIITVGVMVGIGCWGIKNYTTFTDSASLQIRLDYYQNTLNMILEQPFFGMGFGTFKIYYPLYRNNRYTASLGEAARNYWAEHSHNEHLEILSEGGIVGYALFLWMILEAFFRLLKKRTEIDFGLVLALLGLLVDGLFSQNLRYVVIASLLWLIIGCANIDDFSRIVRTRFFIPLNTAQWSALGLVIVLSLSSLHFAYQMMQVEYYMKNGHTLYRLNFHQAALPWYHQALALAPENTNVLYFAAACYRGIDDNEHAMAMYVRLLEISPNFLDAHFRLAEIYLESQELERAAYHFQRQIAINNMHWKSYYELALLEKSQGNILKAIQYLQEILNIEDVSDISDVGEERVKRVETLLSELSAMR